MRGTVKNKYRAVPIKDMPCIKQKLDDPKRLTPVFCQTSPEDSHIIDYFMENLPNSAIAKHR